MPSTHQAPDNRAEEFRRLGNVHFKAGDFASADSAYTSAIDAITSGGQPSSPGDQEELAKVLSNRSCCRMKLGQPAAALEDGVQAAANLPTWWKAHSRCCHALLELTFRAQPTGSADLAAAVLRTVRAALAAEEGAAAPPIPMRQGMEVVPEPPRRPSPSLGEMYAAACMVDAMKACSFHTTADGIESLEAAARISPLPGHPPPAAAAQRLVLVIDPTGSGHHTHLEDALAAAAGAKQTQVIILLLGGSHRGFYDLPDKDLIIAGVPRGDEMPSIFADMSDVFRTRKVTNVLTHAGSSRLQLSGLRLSLMLDAKHGSAVHCLFLPAGCTQPVGLSDCILQCAAGPVLGLAGGTVQLLRCAFLPGQAGITMYDGCQATITDCSFDGLRNMGIEARGIGTRAHLQRCRFLSCTPHSAVAAFGGCQHLDMSECQVSGSGGKQSELEERAALHLACKTASLSKVSITDCPSKGIMCSEGVQLEVRDCEVLRCAEGGIGVFLASGSLERCAVRGNRKCGLAVMMPGRGGGGRKLALRGCTLTGNEPTDLAVNGDLVSLDAACVVGRNTPVPAELMNGGGGGAAAFAGDVGIERLMELMGGAGGTTTEGLAQMMAELARMGPETAKTDSSKQYRKELRSAGSACRVACHCCAKIEAPGGKKFPSCFSCRTVSYCGKECQKADWPVHKLACQAFGKQ